MKQQNPLLYGLIGALIGGAVIWFLTTSVINSNRFGMMRMMGIRPQNNNQTNGTMMGASIDQTFIEQMIPHHQNAISMADIAQQKAQHQEIKTLATNIKTSQSAEITKMKNWYKEWYGSDVTQDDDDNTLGTGMMGGQIRGGMMGNNTDTSTLENSSNFDKSFIEEMIPHHQMAVMMANMLLRSTNRPEMKQLARDIINAQTKEINEMRQWYTDWEYNQ